MNWAKLIRKLREEQRLSRPELAAKCGWSEGSIRAWESGTNIGINGLEDVLQALGCELKVRRTGGTDNVFRSDKRAV